jgi:hypothetical protein
MGDINKGASNPTEAAASQGVSTQQPKPSFRSRFGRNWLLRLAYLPPRLHRGAVERLARGETINSVARWLLRHPNRGDLVKVTSLETMRKYVSVLAEEIRKHQRLNPGPTMDELARSELIAPVPAPPPLGRRPGARFRYVSEYMDDYIRHFNRELLGMGAAQSNWEALERLRRAEEVMGEENPIPLHALMGGRAQASHSLIEALDFLRKNDETQVVKQKVLRDMGDFADEFADFKKPTLDGDKINAQAKAKESSPEPKAENFYAKMPPVDSLFARSYAEKKVAAKKLKEDIERSKPNAAPPAPSS